MGSVRFLMFLLLLSKYEFAEAQGDSGVKSSKTEYPVQRDCMEKTISGEQKSAMCYGFIPTAGRLSPQVVELTIHGAKIDVLRSEVVRNFKLPLTVLRFINCGITRIESNVFESLPNLRIIDLSQNQLAQFPENLFSNSPNLQEVYLNKNQFQNLPKNCFAGTTKLRVINLNNNRLTDVPINLPIGLTELLLRDNQIKFLPILKLNNLNKLDVCENAISFFPQNVVGYPKLESLCIGTAELQQGSNGLQKLTSLRNLTLDGSGTHEAVLGTDLTDGISSCQQLESLRIRSYKLKSLDFIASHPSLQYLQLQQVSVDANSRPTPTIFRSCPELQTLDLTGSRDLAQQILNDQEVKQSLQKLKHLVVKECGLTSLKWFPMPTRQIPQSPLPFPQLTTIDVSGNQLNCDDEQTYDALCYINRMSYNFTSSKGGAEPRIVTPPASTFSSYQAMVVENTDKTMCYSSKTSTGGKPLMGMDFSHCNDTPGTNPIRPSASPRSNETLPIPEEQEGLTQTEIWYIVLGVLLFIFLVLAIVLTVVCCCLKKRRGSQPIPESGKLEDGRGQAQSFQKLKQASSEDKLLSHK